MASKKFKELKTISGRILKVRKNTKERHWTIKTQSDLFRTTPMNKEEFQSSLHWTGNDWQQFLKSDDYYKLHR